MLPKLLSDIEYRVRRAARQKQPPKRERLLIVATQMQAKVSPATKAQRKRRIQEQLDSREEQMTRMALEHMNKKPDSDRSDREALHLGILHSHIN